MCLQCLFDESYLPNSLGTMLGESFIYEEDPPQPSPNADETPEVRFLIFSYLPRKIPLTQFLSSLETNQWFSWVLVVFRIKIAVVIALVSSSNGIAWKPSFYYLMLFFCVCFRLNISRATLFRVWIHMALLTRTITSLIHRLWSCVVCSATCRWRERRPCQCPTTKFIR